MTTATPHQHLTRALLRWPSFGVEHTFLARLNSGMLDAALLADFIPEDFYLACAALKGVPSAIQEIQSLLAEQFRALVHFRLTPANLEDIREAMFAALLVRRPDAAPRLERYSGTGPLAGWMRVGATREVLSWLRKHHC